MTLIEGTCWPVLEVLTGGGGEGGEKGANIDEEAMSVGFFQHSFYAHCFQSGLCLGHDSAHKHWH
jgi:hypothetical protein